MRTVCSILLSSFPEFRYTLWQYRVLTNSLADADKHARRVWRPVKISKYGTFYVRYGFLLVCYSKSVRRTVSEIFDCKNAVILKTELGVSHAWSLEMSPFDRARMTSYWRSVLTVSISFRFWDIQCQKISRPWNPGQLSIRELKVVPFDRLLMVSL